MFDPTSRYYTLPQSQFLALDGSTVAVAGRRLLPASASLQVIATVTPLDGERLDLFAARTLGDPLRFWRICDANDAMDPRDLIDPDRTPLAIPLS